MQQRRARSSWCSCRTGAPKATTSRFPLSPRSTWRRWPPQRPMTRTAAATNPCSRSIAAAGSAARPEKPTKAIVTVRRSSTSPTWPWRTRSAIAGWRKAARRSSATSADPAGGGRRERAGPPATSAPGSPSWRAGSSRTWPWAASRSAATARSRAAPARTCSSRVAGSPTTASSTPPAPRPARMARVKVPAAVGTSRNSWLAACMASAQPTARRVAAAWAGAGPGRGNRAVMASPAKLATMPPWPVTRSTMRAKKRLRRVLSSSAPSRPASARAALSGVKPTMSANSTTPWPCSANGGPSPGAASSRTA